MSRMRFLVLAGCLVLAAAGLAGARFFYAPTETTVTELAPGVFFRKTQWEPEFIGCNQGWVVFKEFVLVIDANFPNQADEVIELIRQTTDKPIRYVFDTHYHGDHADGNMRYVAIGATPIASERSRLEFETKGQQGFDQAQRDKPEEYAELRYEIPALYFPDRMVIDDGEQRVELIHFGHGHTLGDAVAWLPQHGILFTGDACVNGPFNYTGDGNTETWIAALSAMQELPVKQVAPGHGELSDIGLLGLQKRYFIELRGEMQRLLDAGRSLDQIKEEIDLPFYEEWTHVSVRTRTENIEHVHKELTGGVPPHEHSH